MGLDMYLTKHTSVISFYLSSTNQPERKLKITGMPGVNEEKVVQIVEEAAYWRKCNAIHGWFVENVQEGNDNCRTYHVEVSGENCKSLSTLLKICEGIWSCYLKNKNNHGQPNEMAKQFAEENLPNTEGFFFGGKGYDKDYFEWQIKPTIDQLKPIVNGDAPKFYTWYEYRSSW